MSKIYRLTTGQWTKSGKKYRQDWQALADRICSLWPPGQALLCAYDPDVVLMVKGRSEPIIVPADFGLLIADLADKRTSTSNHS